MPARERRQVSTGLLPNALLFANLKTRGAYALGPRLPISSELRFGMNSGAAPTATTARDGAC
jgi:hypothetical protein